MVSHNVGMKFATYKLSDNNEEVMAMLNDLIDAGHVYVNGDGCFIVNVWVKLGDDEDFMVLNLGSNEATAELLAFALVD